MVVPGSISDGGSVQGGLVVWPAFTLAARDGDASLYDRLLEKQKQAQTPEDFYIYMDALLAFRDPQLIERNLNRALSPEIRSQDAPFVISEILNLPNAGPLAWDFTKSHWDAIAKLSSGSAARVVDATATFCSAEQGSQVRDFFASHKVASAERGLNQSLEQIQNCVDLKAQQSPHLAQWLSDHEVHAGQ